MQDSSINILSTMPLAPALIQKAAENNFLIDAAPFIRTDPIKDEAISEKIFKLSEQQLTVVFTSMNAVDAINAYLDGTRPDWKIFCMGAATKDMVLRNFGKDQITGTAGNAAGLADLIIEQKINDVVFFCGHQRRDELPDKLAARKINVHEVVVYRTIATPQKISKNYHGILFFSPSGAESFFTLNKVPPGTILFAIGPTTEKTLQQFSANKIVIGDFPEKIHLLEKAMHYFTTSNHTNEQIKK